MLQDAQEYLPKEGYDRLLSERDIYSQLLLVSFLIDHYYLKKIDHEPTCVEVRKWISATLSSHNSIVKALKEQEDLMKCLETGHQEYDDFSDIRIHEIDFRYFVKGISDDSNSFT